MDVAVPEAGDHGLAGAINDARIGGNLHFAAAADRGDDAVGRDNDRVGKRRGVGRRVDAAADEGERLRGSAGASSPREKEKEKRGAKQISRSCVEPLSLYPARPMSNELTKPYQTCAFPV